MMKRSILIIVLTVRCLMPDMAYAAAPQGSLVKLACPSYADAAHPCKAVYFYGHDGKRHAFPNERVYFTWYADFSSVRTVSASEMAAMALGRNIVYRPGSKPVKFLTDTKLYAVGLGGELRWIVSEAVAAALYGSAWKTMADDISDAFYPDYRFGPQIASGADFSPSAELAAAPGADDNLPATRRSMIVTTAGGSFAVELIKLQTSRFRMITDAAETGDCARDCPVKPLAAYARDHGATIGIHGTYFCPPDYADCATKINSFLWPFFDSTSRVMLNASSLLVHEGPMLAAGADGRYRYYHRTKDFNSVASFEAVNGMALEAAIAHYPSLVENGAIVVHDEARLDEGMKTLKVARGGIGVDEHFTQLVIAKSATVIDLANIFAALGAKNAMNLDGGGTTALLFDGSYILGPGRELANAVLFLPR